MTMKELLRNKGFLFFAIILPILATLLLNVYAPWEEGDYQQGEVKTLVGLNTQMAYLEDVEKFQVKVYNQSSNEVSEELLKNLANAGIFQIFQVKTDGYSEEEIWNSAVYSAEHDRIDAIVILRRTLAGQLGEGKITDSVALYRVGDDERYEWFQECLKANLLALMQKEQIAVHAMDGFRESTDAVAPENISETYNRKIQLEVLEPEWGQEQSILELDVDWNATRMQGYALAIYTVAFAFAGIMILGTIITELQSLVYTRVLISNASLYSYILSKFVVIICSAVLETTVATLSYVALVKVDVGLGIVQFLFILFGMALIFTSLSVSIGVCCGNTLTACLLTFSLWMITCLLGGMYFDISNASETYKKMALLMPQRWGLKASSLFISGSNQGYPLMTMVTATYVIVILLTGVLGLKLSTNKS